jgi:hypothetical protein
MNINDEIQKSRQFHEMNNDNNEIDDEDEDTAARKVEAHTGYRICQHYHVNSRSGVVKTFNEMVKTTWLMQRNFDDAIQPRTRFPSDTPAHVAVFENNLPMLRWLHSKVRVSREPYLFEVCLSFYEGTLSSNRLSPGSGFRCEESPRGNPPSGSW